MNVNTSDTPTCSSRRILRNLSVNTIMATPAFSGRDYIDQVQAIDPDPDHCNFNSLSFPNGYIVANNYLRDSPMSSIRAPHHIPYTPHTNLQSRNLKHSPVRSYYPTPISIKKNVQNYETPLYPPKSSIDYSEANRIIDTPLAEFGSKKIKTYHDSPIKPRLIKISTASNVDSISTVTALPGYNNKYDFKACARTLKMRLGLAYYKVRTNQIRTPLKKLPIPGQTNNHELSSIDHGYADLLVFAANCIASQKSSSHLRARWAGGNSIKEKEKRYHFPNAVRSLGPLDSYVSPRLPLNKTDDSKLPLRPKQEIFTTPVKLKQGKASRINSNDSILSSSPGMQFNSSAKGTPSSMKAARSLLQLGCS
ncbi:hypothetical protein NADFUDRAFT_79007 [Nadsonia fulvescens var. elongata DSM 6958]|uniref:Uncharacterized protein n=1 Tax=Nadsonia fulvescens var. elongata DSM 6958 TaxID=857566 RepID=A0A1E3PI34_9ASCO|nr:hypothetical protein NADFUDRAFT_79007 [Nadsonia fulvescens var. elongata DSM 6958]